MSAAPRPAVWFPAIRTGTGTDIFTERLVAGLRARHLVAEACWLPLRAEYAPWTVSVPRPPRWANVVHVNTWLHPRFTPTHLPAVATLHHSIHDPLLRLYKGSVRAAYHRWWIAHVERAVLRRAHSVVAVSQFAADKARQTLCDVPINVIHNGVDTARFCPGDRARNSNEPFRLLYVGSWRAMKGVDLLAPVMRDLGEGFELHYTGNETPSRVDPALPLNMRALGRLESEAAVVAAMQNADALVLPSRSEGFGLVAAEAMACGLPVIAFQETSAEEVVKNGEAGVLVAMNDVQAIVAAARGLSESPGVRRRMATAGRRRAVERYSLSSMVEAYIATYEALILQRNKE